jgi:hypothetical protein
MNLIDQTSLTVYLAFVLGLAALGMATSIGVAADALRRTSRSNPVTAHTAPTVDVSRRRSGLPAVREDDRAA